jgi:hypothetical protein
MSLGHCFEHACVWRWSFVILPDCDEPLREAFRISLGMANCCVSDRAGVVVDVDLEGLAQLKEILGDYESVLKRLAGKRR